MASAKGATFGKAVRKILSPCLDIIFSSAPCSRPLYLCKFKIIFSHKSAVWNDTVSTAWHMSVERLRWTNPRHRHLLLHCLRGWVVAKNMLVNEIKFTVWLCRAHRFGLTRGCEWIMGRRKFTESKSFYSFPRKLRSVIILTSVCWF